MIPMPRIQLLHLIPTKLKLVLFHQYFHNSMNSSPANILRSYAGFPHKYQMYVEVDACVVYLFVVGVVWMDYGCNSARSGA